MSYFEDFDPAGRARGGLPSGWEEPRKVTSILVDAITPKDHYSSDHAPPSRPPLVAGRDGTRLERRRTWSGSCTERSYTMWASSVWQTRSWRSRSPDGGRVESRQDATRR